MTVTLHSKTKRGIEPKSLDPKATVLPLDQLVKLDFQRIFRYCRTANFCMQEIFSNFANFGRFAKISCSWIFPEWSRGPTLHSWIRTARLMHGHRKLRLTHDFEILRLTPDFETLRLAGAWPNIQYYIVFSKNKIGIFKMHPLSCFCNTGRDLINSWCLLKRKSVPILKFYTWDTIR